MFPKSFDVFIAYHGSYESMGSSTVAGQRNCCGQIVMAFKDNAKHPLYEIGDIIIERKAILLLTLSLLQMLLQIMGRVL